MESKGNFVDKLELYRIENDGEWIKDIETKVYFNPLERILKALGLYRCIDDALTDYAIEDLTSYILTRYSYASVGIDGSSGTDYTLTDLVSPVMTRTLCTKTFDTTYSSNDTAVFTGITTATSDYTLCEFGLHDTLTSGNMGARQVSCTWDVVNGETFGMIWRIVTSRG